MTDGKVRDRYDEYAARDLFVEGEWPHAPSPCFGGVIFNARGEVLLREPKDYFAGYHWTFYKGRPESGEAPIQTALRETLEETGRRPKVVSHIRGAFSSGDSESYFYLMVDEADVIDTEPMNDETSDQKWVRPSDAVSLIEQTTFARGRARDLKILKAACNAFTEFQVHN